MELFILASSLVTLTGFAVYQLRQRWDLSDLDDELESSEPAAVYKRDAPKLMTEATRRIMARQRRLDAEKLRRVEGDASKLFELVMTKRESKRVRAQALTDLTVCSPEVAEPYLLQIFDGDDAYLRVKLAIFTLRKGFREDRYPGLTGKQAGIVRAELVRGGRSVSTKRMLLRALMRYRRAEYEFEVLQALRSASGHLRRELLGYLEAFGTMMSVKALEATPTRRRFGKPQRDARLQSIIDTIRLREEACRGAVSFTSAPVGGLSQVSDT